MIVKSGQYREAIRRRRPALDGGNSKSEPSPLLKRLGFLLASLSVTGGLFGYGVALGLSSQFGLGTGAWFSSTLELISLTGEGFIGLISIFSEGSKLLDRTWGYLLGYAGLSMALSCLFWLVMTFKKQVGEFLFAKLRGLLLQIAPRDEWRAEERSPRTVFVEGLFVIVFSSVGGFLALPFIAFVFALVIALIGILPSIGSFAGVAYARAIVLEPEDCVSGPAKLRAFGKYNDTAKAPKQAKHGTHCVEVMSLTGGLSETGKVVISRPSYLMIYRPAHDDVIMLQTKDVRVRTLSQLSTEKSKDANGELAEPPGR
jgi:hypothetical protein